MINLVLWAVGIVLVIIAASRVRAPFARMTELDQLADNARRYESWRGGRTSGADNGPTGADVMRELLRRQGYLWVAVGIAGIVLIVAGFMVR